MVDGTCFHCWESGGPLSVDVALVEGELDWLVVPVVEGVVGITKS